MKPSDAVDELHQHNVFVPTHRLAELFSVIDGELWSPVDEAGLKARLADYMAINRVSPRESPDQPYLDGLRGE